MAALTFSFVLKKHSRQISVADLNARTPSFYVDIAHPHYRGARRRAFLQQAGQRVYRSDATRRNAALIAQKTLAHAATTKTFVLAKLGNVGTTTGAKLVYCIGIADRLGN